MPRRSWKRSDNIKRALSERRVEALLTVFRGLRAKNAPWVEMDAEDAEAWWRAVLRDSRARRTRADHIPVDDVDAVSIGVGSGPSLGGAPTEVNKTRLSVIRPEQTSDLN